MTHFVPCRLAVGEVALPVSIEDDMLRRCSIVSKQSVWKIRRLNVTAVFCGQHVAGFVSDGPKGDS